MMATPATSQPVEHDGHQKRLGQFFTGERPARLLAALTGAHESDRVLDPMLGVGDMLLGVLSLGSPTTLGGVEIDPSVFAKSKERLPSESHLVLGSAFAPAVIDELPTTAWRTVISNPPYVRYQRSARADSRVPRIPSSLEIRQNLMETIDLLDALDTTDKRLFRAMAHGYSGLADLAVPSWILCAGLVEVGGTLGMLVPTTWLSRDYAHPIRYMLHRWFELGCVVEDGDATWFPDALVRTALVVAKRVPRRESAFSASPDSGYTHVRLEQQLANGRSLVAGLYPGERDADLALGRDIKKRCAPKLVARWVPTAPDQRALCDAVSEQAWLKPLESVTPPNGTSAPHPGLAAMVGKPNAGFVTLEGLGWRVGQGLRTGANRFFYFSEGEDLERLVPPQASAHALRRQAELPEGFAIRAHELPGRVLVLHDLALPEQVAGTQYEAMEDGLADYVRRMATVNIGTDESPRFIPELTAVAPNGRNGRFWFQLPALTDRHKPSLLVPRINNSHPKTFINVDRRAVIDANFATLWAAEDSAISADALLALLNSSWWIAQAELACTIMGGGALKLEATHLRRFILPQLDWDELNTLGEALAIGSAQVSDIDGVVFQAIGGQKTRARVCQLLRIKLDQRRRHLEGARLIAPTADLGVSSAVKE